MSNQGHSRRATSGYDYPPAIPGPEIQDPYVSDGTSSEQEDWTIHDTQPLTQHDRPGITPEALTVVNHIRAQRGQQAGRRARISQQPPSNHTSTTEPRGAHARPSGPLPAGARSRMRRVLRSLRDDPDYSWHDRSASTAAIQHSSSRHHPPPPRRSSLHRHHGSRVQRVQDSYMAELHEQGQRLAQQNEDVSTSIAAMPSYQAPAQGRRQRSGSDDAEGHRDRRKRRRIEAPESPLQNRPLIQYGYKGQVVPGKLDMELLSADGGAHEPSFAHLQGRYGVENILQDDGKVYCTQGSACNIVLRHKAETAFTMDHLVIKAPCEGFTNPVEEGLIFMANELDSTFDLTSKYKIHYWPKCYFAKFYPDYEPQRSRRRRRPASALDEAWPALQPMRSGPVPRAMALQDEEDPRLRDGCVDGSESDESSVTLSEDESDEESDASSTAILRPLRRQNADDPQDDDLINAYEFLREQRLQGRRGAGQDLNTLIARGEHAQAARGTGPARPNVDEARPEAQTLIPDRLPPGWHHPDMDRPTNVATDEDNEGTEGKIYDPDFTLLVPAARFSMGHHRRKKRRDQEHGAHVMTVKFDPPISGRYLLLKLWNPQQEKNIDIQNLTVFGYAGPRWYPATELC